MRRGASQRGDLICRRAGADWTRQDAVMKTTMSHRAMLILAAIALAVILLVVMRQHGAF
jgi:hypothetical protein